MARRSVLVGAAATLALGGVPSVQRTSAPVVFDPREVELLALQARAGDLVFRATSSVHGLAVRGSSIGERYSHVGCVLGWPQQVRVLHAQPASATGAGGVLLQSVPDFAAEPGTWRLALWRVRATQPDAAALQRQAYAWLKAGVPFDEALDTKSAHELYCTELVLRLLEYAGVPMYWVELRELALLGKRVIYPSALLLRADLLREIEAHAPSLKPI